MSRPPMFREILLTIDLNHESSWRKTLPAAVALCRSFEGRLHLMTVVPDYGMAIVGQFFPKDYEHRALEAARQHLHEFVDANVPKDVPTQCIVAHGTVYEEILRESREIGADLIVIGSHRPELKDYLLGPNAARVVRHADASVLVVRE
jgi:nucleotide-binding universal stress UspA family protein